MNENTLTDHTRKYPRKITLSDGRDVEIKLMTGEHTDLMLAFARSLPEEDLLFLRVDITEPDVVADWVEKLDRGFMTSIVALDGENLVAYATIQRDPTRWTRRVGEIRVNVAPSLRRLGLGRNLIAQVFDLARSLGLKKLMANMTLDQRAAQAAFRRLGFTPEAVLADFVEDRSAQLRDLVIMTYDVDGLSADAGEPLRVD
ncbi:MAG: GNAT family N-acetyltransferase [Gammaproteobacteria bacterium]|nr:GNAT family N-acetyltransferase [Gammaproteobacteria bacterium]